MYRPFPCSPAAVHWSPDDADVRCDRDHALRVESSFQPPIVRTVSLVRLLLSTVLVITLFPNFAISFEDHTAYSAHSKSIPISSFASAISPSYCANFICKSNVLRPRRLRRHLNLRSYEIAVVGVTTTRYRNLFFHVVMLCL